MAASHLELGCGVSGARMFSQLPLFIAIGFLIGFQWRPDWEWAWGLGGFTRRATAVLAGLVVVVLLELTLNERPHAAGIYLAATVVGWAGGRWFQVAPWGRDKIVAIAGAALFVAVSGFEYETGALRHITRFSAGSVDLELSSESAANSGSSPQLIDNIEDDAFPGQYRLNFAIYYLDELPNMIDRDEKYAEMFSGFSSNSKDSNGRSSQDEENLPAPVIEPATNEYLHFYCNKVILLVDRLSKIQEFHKGEIASVNLPTSLIQSLRLAYESTLKMKSPPKVRPTPRQSMWLDSPPFWDESDPLENEIRSAYDNARKEVHIITIKEAESLETCKDIAASDPQAAVEGKREPSGLPDLSRKEKYSAQDVYAFAAYFAMTSAVAEFALDNRERALQLLDDFIANGSPFERNDKADKKSNANYAKDSSETLAYHKCYDRHDASQAKDEDAKNRCKGTVDRLGRARKLVVRARLETLEDQIIEVSENSSLTAIRIPLLIRAIDDMDAAVDMFHDTSGYNKQSFATASFGIAGSGCQLPKPTQMEGKNLVALWTAALMAAMGNALDAAALRPDVVNANSSLTPFLDGYANTLSAFDADCAVANANANKTAKNKVLKPTLRSYLLTQSAGYFEAKGNLFGALPFDYSEEATLYDNLPARISAFCEAQKDFTFAHELFLPYAQTTPPKADHLPLDTLADNYKSARFLKRLEAGAKRNSAALKHFPAGDVEKYCGESANPKTEHGSIERRDIR